MRVLNLPRRKAEAAELDHFGKNARGDFIGRQRAEVEPGRRFDARNLLFTQAALAQILCPAGEFLFARHKRDVGRAAAGGDFKRAFVVVTLRRNDDKGQWTHRQT